MIFWSDDISHSDCYDTKLNVMVVIVLMHHFTAYPFQALWSDYILGISMVYMGHVSKKWCAMNAFRDSGVLYSLNMYWKWTRTPLAPSIDIFRQFVHVYIIMDTLGQRISLIVSLRFPRILAPLYVWKMAGIDFLGGWFIYDGLRRQRSRL